MAETLGLAIEGSALKQLGAGAVRSAAARLVGEMYREGTLRLQPLWALLEGQPGFEPEAARPCFCWLKSVEGRLGITVELPRALDSLSVLDRGRLAALCLVRSADFERLLASGSSAPTARGSSPALGSTPPAGSATDSRAPSARRSQPQLARGSRPPVARDSRPPVARDSRPPAPRRGLPRVVGWIAAGVAAAALGGLLVYLAPSCGSHARSIEAAGFAGDLPVRAGRRLGTQVTVELADPGWRSLPEATRRAQLEAALRRLPEGATALVVVDGKDVAAAAQWYGTPPAPVVRLY